MTDAIRELLDKDSKRRLRLATHLWYCSEFSPTFMQQGATELRTADSQIRDMAEALVKAEEFIREDRDAFLESVTIKRGDRKGIDPIDADFLDEYDAVLVTIRAALPQEKP